MKKNRFSYKVVTDPQDIARYLEALSQGFKEGHLPLTDQGHKIHLRPTEIIDLTIETSRRLGQTRLSLNFSWPDEDRRSTLDFDESFGFDGSKTIPPIKTPD